jgi:nucleoid-associated protein YgaU
MITQTLTVAGGNLFQIAAAQLGDAMQWVNIAQANGLADPFLNGLQLLIIPPANPAFSDGLGQQ